MTESWTKEEILERVTQILVDSFELDRDAIRPDSHVVDDLDLDSIDAIDLAVGLHEQTGFELAEEELKGIRVVQDIVDLVSSKLPSA